MKKWKESVSVSVCRGVFDVLVAIYKRRGDLPRGKSPKDLKGISAGKLLDYADAVAQNDAWWAGLPEIIKPTKKDVERAAQALFELTSRNQGVRMPGAPTNKSLFASFAKGQKRDKLRSDLMELLKECRD